MSELDPGQIRERIVRGEDEATEFKRWEAFPKGVAQGLCAFANSNGGLIILGVADSGQIAGVGEGARIVQEKLTSLLHSGLSAPVRAALGYHQFPEG